MVMDRGYKQVFKVLSGSGLMTLTEEINEHLADGYDLAGNMFVLDNYFYQPMLKFEITKNIESGVVFDEYDTTGKLVSSEKVNFNTEVNVIEQ